MPKKYSGKEAAEVLTRSWGVVKYVLANCRLRRDEQHDLQSYITIMERVELIGREQQFLDDEDKKGDGKTIKLRGDEASRLYLQGGATKPLTREFPCCARCNHTLIDEPKSNKSTKRQNDCMRREANHKHEIWKEWSMGRGPALLDENCNIVKKWKWPKFEDELLVCHCVQNHHSNAVGGAKCFLHCYDQATKKQYPQGECPACKCDCRFVCSKL